ncbi:MAG: hypothetical protein IPL29_11010 [Propionivibrio sp.]|uniref:hypothetical protein n=1 Tax=Propionivibrio sp. TaxID=2212460 RepID=UPI0025CD19A2|nr:hypothetical protein [Propionivibrio sp.]MBK7357019.1 hypothetical protein [Propionivibrio sp.]MBK8401551.1 hypothetical protein [Propionivibrio sp.]MBK8894039.1 hypothetical protein [Propionivibrio sp.]MBL0209069.1 hypothetical protein [Propionivibrio sp.]
MKRLLVTMVCVLSSSTVFAVEISEDMVNKYVEQGLAKRANRKVQILNPKVTLLEGFATLCATVHAKAYPKDVDFCADMTPKWRQETGSLLATKMTLVSLNAPGVSDKDIELVKLIVNQGVLPRLEGTEIYRADGFIGKQISGVTVLPGKLDLSL